MEKCIGIRREDKNEWERRVPLTPLNVRELKEKYGIETRVQPSRIRIFPDRQYTEAGGRIDENLSVCPFVFAVKEIPVDFIETGKVYVFFSHTIKGQKSNMPLLQKILDLECTLIDYEKIVDEKGTRLIFFGKFAGYAGMIDTLWAFGQRLEWEGIPNPLSAVRQTTDYASLDEAKEKIACIGKKIELHKLQKSISPVIFGFAGYGNVSQGAQEIFDLLPHEEVNPEDLAQFAGREDHRPNLFYKVIFKEEHMVEPVSSHVVFDLNDYYTHPEKYRSKFESVVPYLTVLVNCIYWDARYPRLLTRQFLKRLFQDVKKPRLRVIGDITCDVDGAVECTVKCTDPGNPVYVYDSLEERVSPGVEGVGPVILAVDNLPCELPAESSKSFGDVLIKFVPEIVRADYSVPFADLRLSDPLKNAVIAYKGKLTPDFKYIEKFF